MMLFFEKRHIKTWISMMLLFAFLTVTAFTTRLISIAMNVSRTSAFILNLVFIAALFLGIGIVYFFVFELPYIWQDHFEEEVDVRLK